MAISSRAIFILFNLLCIQASTIDATDPSSSKCISKERSSLIKFKNSLTDETGRLSSWTGQECCSWKGITCNNKTGHVLKLDLHNPTPFDIDRFYNAEDSAYVASYSKTCLSGQLNPALLDLKNLLFLDLSYNNFSSSGIPRFFGELESLTHLDLSVARFQGTVPFEIGNLSGLQFLDMGDFWENRLISNSLNWASRLSSLRHLDLSGVHLGKAKDWLDSVSMLPSLIKLNMSNTLIPSIYPLSLPRFTSLVSFDLQWNTIDSELPSWLFNISSLVELRLDGNGFYGPILEDLGRLSSLKVLGLSSNFLNSSLPNSLFRLTNLSYLDLSQNLFQETVPKGLLNLCNLKFLDLTQTGFTGSIPDFGVNQSGCLRDLEYLRLSHNSLNGPIPPSLGTLTSLRELDMSNNLFSSSIPSSLGQLPNLVKLDISNNSLSEMVSDSHFAKLSKLTELSMHQNSIIFNISSHWIPPFQLQTIKLSSCTLGPLFPSWLRTQQDVVELRILRAGISDTLPDWFEKLYSHVHYLDMSKNNISGKLPKFEETNSPGRRLILNSNGFHGPLRPLPSDVLLFDISNNMVSGSIDPVQNGKNMSLEVMILSNNKLNGSLPNFLCEMKEIMILDVANNQFSGRMPDCIGDLQKLSMLDFTNNSFHGEIPKSLTGLQLTSLHLHGNNFHGELPSLENMTFLHILDVGKNSFTGAIPPWIGANMQNLAFLSFQSNRFHGAIPPALCQLPQLQLLNLAGNGMVGTIPPCLGNVSAMIAGRGSGGYLTLDVDYGASLFEIVSGMERLYTTTMPFLTSVDLCNNSIAGEIPEGLTQLAGLRNLNLAGNGLTGRIPESIGEMRELISMDLSRNRISGRIPEGLSGLHFLSYLNLSFNDLSGRIPTGYQLRTLDSSAYAGNDGLCGAPLARGCDGDPPARERGGGGGGGGGSEDEEEGDGLWLFPWFYGGIGPGFVVGFLVVCGVLHFVKSWRYAFFQCIENVVVGR